MGCHTWFYKDRDVTPMEEVVELHDMFRHTGKYVPVLSSYKETLELIDRDGIRVDYTELQEFWNKWPNGQIEFG